MRRIIAATLALLSSVLLSLVLPPLAHAYDNDTHYVLTYYLARQVGFTVEQARQIASADVSVDAESKTEPLQTLAVLNPVGNAESPRFRFHAFPDSRTYAIEIARLVDAGSDATAAEHEAKTIAIARRDARQQFLWDAALASGNPGLYLHFEQDTFSHDGYWSFRGHALAGHSPDFLSADTDKALRMADQTVATLEKFMHACTGRVPKPINMQEMRAVVLKLAALNPHDSAANRLFSYDFVTGHGVPVWDIVAEAVSGLLGEPVPAWFDYHYEANGTSSDPNWRVKDCTALPKVYELRVKVVDEASGTGLSDASVLLSLGEQGKVKASGTTVDAMVTFANLLDEDVTYHVLVNRTDYETGKGSIRFNCPQCESQLLIKLKKRAGVDLAQFNANLAREEAIIKTRIARLHAIRDDDLRDFNAEVQVMEGLVAQREAAQKARTGAAGGTGGAGAMSFAALAGALGEAGQVCAQLQSATGKLGQTLAGMQAEEDTLEQILKQTSQAPSRCTDQAAIANATRVLGQADGLQLTLDQQAAALPLLALQLDSLHDKRTALLKQRVQAAHLLSANNATVAAVAMPAPTPNDFTHLQARLASLSMDDKGWAAGAHAELMARIEPFITANKDLAPAETIRAATDMLRQLIDVVPGFAYPDAELQRYAALVDSLRVRSNQAMQGAQAPQDRPALQAAVDAAACLDAPGPDLSAGLATANNIRATGQLALSMMGEQIRRFVGQCLGLQPGAPAPASAPATALDCTAFAHTQSRADSGTGVLSCACVDGYVRNGPGGCEPDKAALLARANCSAYPNTQPSWDASTARAVCDCKRGYRWNERRDACAADQQAQMAQANCAARFANTEPYWDSAQQQARCRCRTGFSWNKVRQACLNEAPDPGLEALLGEVRGNLQQADTVHRAETLVAAEQTDKNNQADNGPSIGEQMNGPTLLSKLTAALQAGQNMQQGGNGAAAQPAPPANWPRATPATPAPANSRPAAATATATPSGKRRGDNFNITGTAFPNNDRNYQKHLDCRYLRAFILSKAVEDTSPGEIEQAVAALQARGHMKVEAHYFDGAQAMTRVEQAQRGEREGRTACENAIRREKLEPR